MGNSEFKTYNAYEYLNLSSNINQKSPNGIKGCSILYVYMYDNRWIKKRKQNIKIGNKFLFSFMILRIKLYSFKIADDEWRRHSNYGLKHQTQN